MNLLQIYCWVRQWKKCWKSVNIWWSCRQEFGVLFFLTYSVVKVIIQALLLVSCYHTRRNNGWKVGGELRWGWILFFPRSLPVSHYCSTHVSPIPTLLSSSFKFSWEVGGNTVSFQQCRATKWQPVAKVGKSKGSPYSIAERRVPELIPVVGSQPAGDVSHKPGGRLPLLFAKACSYPHNP